MQRLRLKADGRIVELRDGGEFPLAPATALGAPAIASVTPANGSSSTAVRDLRRRARLTQQEFASRLGVPVETIRFSPSSRTLRTQSLRLWPELEVGSKRSSGMHPCVGWQRDSART